MENSQSILGLTINVIRWIARFLAAFMILLTLVFFLDEEVFDKSPERGEPIPITMIMLALLMLGGLGLAFKWELPGGIISLIGFTGIIISNTDSASMPMFYLYAVPAVLFLLCGLKKGTRDKGPGTMNNEQ
jgi:hypothetical protein